VNGSQSKITHRNLAYIPNLKIGQVPSLGKNGQVLASGTNGQVLSLGKNGQVNRILKTLAWEQETDKGKLDQCRGTDQASAAWRNREEKDPVAKRKLHFRLK
jgi:hypothetical protein